MIAPAQHGSHPIAIDSQRQSYARLREEIRDGDWLLWRPTTLAGHLICWATGEKYSHASMAVWIGKRLYNAEMIQWHGGRRRPLSYQIAIPWPV